MVYSIIKFCLGCKGDISILLNRSLKVVAVGVSPSFLFVEPKTTMLSSLKRLPSTGSKSSNQSKSNKRVDNTTNISPLSKQRSQHRSLITIVHTKTLTLAKTVQKYPRKHRDLSANGVLNDAVEALAEFKEVEWPPKRDEMESILDNVPSWLGGDESERSGDGGAEGNGGEGVSQSLHDVVEEKVSVSETTSVVSASDVVSASEGEDIVDSSHGKKLQAAEKTLGKELDDANLQEKIAKERELAKIRERRTLQDDEKKQLEGEVAILKNQLSAFATEL